MPGTAPVLPEERKPVEEIGARAPSTKALARRLPSWLIVVFMALSLSAAFGFAAHRAVTCYPAAGYSLQKVTAGRCYSDIPYLYTGRGLASNLYPYDNSSPLRKDFPVSKDNQAGVLEYPPIISYFAYGVARISNSFHPLPSPRIYGEAKAGIPPGQYLYDASPEARADTAHYYYLTAFLLFLGACGIALLLWRTLLRPHRALWFTTAPLLGLTAFINWDILAVLFATGSLYAWRKDRRLLAAVLLGLGGATKLYPLILVLGPAALLLRERRFRECGKFMATAFGTFVLASLPAMLTGLPEWKYFWTFNSQRGPDFGSSWLGLELLSNHGVTLSTPLTNLLSYGAFAVACGGVVLLALKAPTPPSYARLALLLVVAFAITQKVYSPQYVLWLLPLVILADLPWQSMVVWQLTECYYFWKLWPYIAHTSVAPGRDSSWDIPYGHAILIRIVGELVLLGVILRKVLKGSSGAPDAGLELSSGALRGDTNDGKAAQ